jgi:hypothetical protein
MSEQLPNNIPPPGERKWYEYGPRELVMRALGGASIERIPKEPIPTRIMHFLYGEESDKWHKERLKPYVWRRMPPGMRSAKGGLGLDQTADSTVEPGVVIELKESGAKNRILAKRKAPESAISETPPPSEK